MKITKHGTNRIIYNNVQQIQPSIKVKFICPYCGCEWECEPHECITNNTTAIQYRSKCPECDMDVHQYILEYTY